MNNENKSNSCPASSELLIGIFKDDEHMVHALEELKAKQVPVYDCYTPFPIHGIEDLIGIKRTRLPIITFVVALLGASAAMSFQYWVSAVAWPINYGGKPFASFPAFIPITFEIAILSSALTTVLFFFIRNKMAPHIRAKVPTKKVTDDEFVIAVDATCPKINVDHIKEIFLRHHAKEVRKSEESKW